MSKGSIPKKLLMEIRKLIPVIIYFFLAFAALGLTKWMCLREAGDSDWAGRISTVLVHSAIGAVLIAKVVLVMELLPFLEPFSRRPIIFNAAWKSLVSLVLGIAVQLLEEALPLLLHHHSLEPVYRRLGEPVFWLIQFWLALLFLGFWLFKDLLREIGHPAAGEIFWVLRKKRAR